jgi:hypothetical protein
MAGNYSITIRADGLILTGAIYNADHQNHVDNCTPTGLDDYSLDVAQMRTQTDPGTPGSESMATSIAGEIARLRFVLARLIDKTYWYDVPAASAAITGNLTLTAADFGYQNVNKFITANADITLPLANAVATTKRASFKNTGAFTVNLLRAGTDTIDGRTSYRIPPFSSFELASDGTTGWQVLGNPIENAGSVALADGANIAWDLAAAPAATLTLAGNRTLDNPTNKRAGSSFALLVSQDGTGVRTLAYGTDYKWPDGIAPILTTTANRKDLLTFYCDGTSLFGSIIFDFA